MATTVNKIISLAQSLIGKNEKDGSHKSIIDIYNGHKPLARNYKVKYTDSWCATFISYLAIKCNATDIIPTECSCEKMIALMRTMGIWIENENRVPNVGDIIFYDWQDNGVGDNKGWSDHVGIVEKVSGSTITVIEGNKNDSVARRNIAVNGKYIRGYGVPNYSVETTSIHYPTKSVTEVAKEVIAGKWDNGTYRKNALEKAGYNYSEVQAKVNELSKAGSSTSTNSAPKKTPQARYIVGRNYTLQVELKVRTGAGKNYSAKKRSQLTVDGRKHDKDGDGALEKGTVVTCQEVINVGDDIWIKCPSGYLAAYYQGKVYIK